MAKIKILLDRSPVETNQPCAKQVGDPTSIALFFSALILSKKASACWISARRRLYIKKRN
jgi:hypothetical protein